MQYSRLTLAISLMVSLWYAYISSFGASALQDTPRRAEREEIEGQGNRTKRFR